MHGIAAYKTYTNMKGYDLVATSPVSGTSCRIQVKSRWPSNAQGFLINSLDCDFIVFVKLNRGIKGRTLDPTDPEYFVFPTALIARVQETRGLKKVSFSKIPDMESYASRWDLIRADLLRARKKTPHA